MCLLQAIKGWTKLKSARTLIGSTWHGMLSNTVEPALLANSLNLAYIPIGQPWQLIDVDILQVSLSTNNNRHLLVLKDYFTKWVDAFPLD